MTDVIPRGLGGPKLEQWLVAQLGMQPPLTYRLIAGGYSNLTYQLAGQGGATFVLRRPPLGDVPPGAHDVLRESRIQNALKDTLVPVPVIEAICADISVIDAPFYIMKWIDGIVVDRPERVSSAFAGNADRALATSDVVDILADLHRIDLDAVGLGDLGRRESFARRVLDRTKRVWDRIKTRELPQIDELYQRMLALLPKQRHTGLVHGDYRLGNIMMNGGRAAAILDWELCTPGDVMMDLAALLNNWDLPEDPFPQVWLETPPTRGGGFPSREFLVSRYAGRTGFDVTNLDYYRALNYWRIAVIGEGIKRPYLIRAMDGQQTNLDVLETRIRDRAKMAEHSLARVV